MENYNQIKNEAEIYRSYIKAKCKSDYSVVKLCIKLGIPRPTLYAIVKRVEKGDSIQLARCILKSKYDCIWEHKYARRFYVISELEDTKNVSQLRLMIKQMYEDGFGIREIARRVSKDVSTVSYHVNK